MLRSPRKMRRRYSTWPQPSTRTIRWPGHPMLRSPRALARAFGLVSDLAGPRIFWRRGGGGARLGRRSACSKGLEAPERRPVSRRFVTHGRMLYQGPWVAERLHATQALLRENPEAVLPVTREIIERARAYRALDAYRAIYELAALRRVVDCVFTGVDVLLLPTGTIYRNRGRSGRSDRPQRQSRALYQLCESAGSRGDRAAGRVWRGWAPFRNFADCSGLSRFCAARLGNALPGDRRLATGCQPRPNIAHFLCDASTVFIILCTCDAAFTREISFAP